MSGKRTQNDKHFFKGRRYQLASLRMVSHDCTARCSAALSQLVSLISGGLDSSAASDSSYGARTSDFVLDGIEEEEEEELASLRAASRHGRRAAPSPADDCSGTAALGAPSPRPSKPVTIESMLQGAVAPKPKHDIFDRMLLKSGLNKAQRKQKEVRERAAAEVMKLSEKGQLFSAESQKLVGEAEREAQDLSLPWQWQEHVNAETLLVSKSKLRGANAAAPSVLLSSLPPRPGRPGRRT